jgi:hypothetical protein
MKVYILNSKISGEKNLYLYKFNIITFSIPVLQYIVSIDVALV